MSDKIAYLGEDENFYRLLSGILQGSGYEAIHYRSPAVLVAELSSRAEDFAVLLLDLGDHPVVPTEVYLVMARIPTVIIGSDATRAQGLLPGRDVPRLSKPLSVPRLLSLLQRLSRSTADGKRGKDGDKRDRDPGLVMVVDDDPGFRLFVEEVLKSAGYEVVSAADGVEALEMLEDLPEPSAFAIDLEMPRMNGRELSARLHELYDSPAILVMTGTRNEELLEWARSSGKSYALIEKPFSSRTFLRYFKR